ncbi:hypothetical protein BTH42_28655 [Burkholderia sp. SRS-W-2-2016]|uniref:response regulator transcription factor n=1 Tax=Burkholderia sp. SRS-W-2-2016 TaxID=1926878 RepID=UPI00094B7481|nr:response regulator transcription factor [Burkholderia sp. SRS-W-2-2016]OLL28242.1 hypothetical protein BTH42_28655 [Burkholderia sp. SRS-W-2-2016]
MKIAVLDADPLAVEFVVRHMSKAGYICHAFFDARELLDHFHNQNYDLLILDCALSGRSGEETMDWVRTSLSQTLPVIFLSARSTEQDVLSILDAGADCYIIKPVSEMMLLARINAILRRAMLSRL